MYCWAALAKTVSRPWLPILFLNYPLVSKTPQSTGLKRKTHFPREATKKLPMRNMNHSHKFHSKQATPSSKNDRVSLCCYEKCKACLPEISIMCNLADHFLNIFSFGKKFLLRRLLMTEWLCYIRQPQNYDFGYQGHSEDTHWPYWHYLLLQSFTSWSRTLKMPSFPEYL